MSLIGRKEKKHGVELAVHIANAEKVQYISEPFKTSPLVAAQLANLSLEEAAQIPTNKYFASLLSVRKLELTMKAIKGLAYSRVYFGNEFCERLIPSVQDLADISLETEKKELGLTLVTPYVNDQGLRRLRPVLSFLNECPSKGGPLEVVVNDWGVLRVVRTKFKNLMPVLGRLMNKMKRDPRVSKVMGTLGLPPDALQAFKQSSITVPRYREFLEEQGVHRVEFDYLDQGMEMDFNKMGVDASVYLPYSYVTTGRVCMIGSLNVRAEDKFTVFQGCGRECRAYTVMLSSAAPFRYIEVAYQGNTVFHILDQVDFESVLRAGFSRIVFQPEIPM